MAEMILGFESWINTFFTFIILFVYAIYTIKITKKAFSRKHPYRFNGVIVVLSIFFLAFSILLGNFTLRPLVPYPLSFFFNIWTILSLICILFYFRKQIVVKEISMPSKQQGEITSAMSFSGEIRRKTFHISSLYFAFVLFAGYLLIKAINWLVTSFFTGIVSLELINNLGVLAESDPWYSGNALLSFVWLCFSIFQFNIEIIRLNYPTRRYPFRRLLESVQRLSEKQMLGNNVILLATFQQIQVIFFYGVLDLTDASSALVTSLFIILLANVFAVLIGRRYGKHKWHRFPGRSKEGTLAGVIVTLYVSLIFVGFYLALISVGIFLLVDLNSSRSNLNESWLLGLLIGIFYVVCQSLILPIIPIKPFSLS